MKHILLVISLLILVTESFSQNIFGTCKFKDGDSVYLASISRGGLVPIDSCLVKNGKFSLKDQVEATVIRAVLIIENKMPVAGTEVVVEKGVDLTINFKDNTIEIPNSKSNAVWRELTHFEENQTKKIESYWTVMGDSTKNIEEKLKAKFAIDSITNATYSKYAQVIYDNIPSNISGMLLGQYHSNLSESDLTNILEAMKKKSPKDPYYQALTKRMEIEAQTSVGQPFKEVAMVDINGNMTRLSTVVKANKLVLIDFWASWCAPCIAEMPNVRKIYAAYHAKGLEIYGISLDENQINWLSAIQRLGINWIHVSDLKGWQSKAAQDYSIQSIPSTLLIDSTGKIIAKNLRGADLEKKIAEILK